MEFFDSHAHYNDARFDEEYPGGAEAAIMASREAGAAAILNAGTNAETTRESISLAEKFDFFYASAGIHPYDCAFVDKDINSAIAEIEELAADPKVRAIGEIGLDYHYENTDRDLQKEYFIAQMELASQLKMPVIIHDRDAHGDIYDILRSFKDVKVLLHSFSGSAEAARQLTVDGRYISFSGTVTYKNARNVHESAAAVPDEFLLVETDAPYLPPVPHRGKMNYSAYLPHTISQIAEIRGVSPESIARLTMSNAKRLFGIGEN